MGERPYDKAVEVFIIGREARDLQTLELGLGV